MKNGLRNLAMAANVVFLLAILVLWSENRPHRLEEYLFFIALFALPVLNFFALAGGPDREERLLRRQVNKAELRKRLKELEGSN